MKFKTLFKKMILPVLASLAVFVLVSQDSFLYKEPVAKIIAVENVSTKKITDGFQNSDKELKQKLTLQLLNQNQEEVTLENVVNQSQVTGQIYRKGQELILKKQGESYQIFTLKRDALMAALLTLFVGFLLTFVRLKASIFLLLSLLLNLIYFMLAVQFNLRFNPPVLLIFGFLAVLFAASSLLFVLGASKQMFYTFVTTILTTILTFLLTFLVLKLTGNSGIHFEYLEYVTEDPTQFFFVGAIISVLGAIMDGTGDIVAGLFGIYRQNQLNHNQMSYKNYIKSGISIGQEIIGTLTNVLFMIFMAEALPMTFLLLKNGNTWDYIATVGLNLGLLQTVISAIGIILAVPVTAFITSLGLVCQSEKEMEVRK